MKQPTIVNRCAEEQAEGGRRAIIRHLNDMLRQTGEGGRTMMTAGVAALPEPERLAILAAVAAFEAFTEENDPHREHDLALLQVGGQRVIFKIDAYDTNLVFGSPDPADPAVTCRVLTIMLADEY